jgi:hypothetical protein
LPLEGSEIASSIADENIDTRRMTEHGKDVIAID